MNLEEGRQQDAISDSLIKYSVSRGCRNRFISLIVEQIRRFQARTFEDSRSYVGSKRTSFTKSPTSATLYLKLYAGQINSILIFFHDLIRSEEHRTMALYWHEIVSKCRQLESELCRYSRSTLQSDLETTNQNVKLTEEELNRLLDFINNLPAILLSQGDSQQSISDTVTKIQEKIQDILGHSKKTGIIQAELLFVGDMKAILNTVQGLSRSVMNTHGLKIPPVEMSTLTTEAYSEIVGQEGVGGKDSIDSEEDLSADLSKVGDEQRTNNEENESKNITIANALNNRTAEKFQSGTSLSSKQNSNKFSDHTVIGTHEQDEKSFKLSFESKDEERHSEKGSESELSKLIPNNEFEPKIQNELREVNKHVNEERRQNVDADERSLPKYVVTELYSSTNAEKEPLQNEAHSANTDHKEDSHSQRNVIKTPSLYDEIVEAGEADFLKLDRRRPGVEDTTAYDKNIVDDTLVVRMAGRRKRKKSEVNGKKVDREGGFSCSHEVTVRICVEVDEEKTKPIHVKDNDQEQLGKILDHSNVDVTKQVDHMIGQDTKCYPDEDLQEKYTAESRAPVKVEFMNDLDEKSYIDLVERNYSKDDIPKEDCDRATTNSKEYSEIASYCNSHSGASDMDLVELNSRYYSKDDIPSDLERASTKYIEHSEKTCDNVIFSYSNSLVNESEVDLVELNTQFYSKDDIPEDYWDRVANECIDDKYPGEPGADEASSYSNSLESASEVDLVELNTQHFSKDDIPEDYWDRLTKEYSDKACDDEVCSYSNSLETVSNVDLVELNTMYYSNDDIPEDYLDRSIQPMDIWYLDDLDEYSDVDLNELNTQFYSINDVPEEYCDRVQCHSEEFYSNDLDELSEADMDELNFQFYSLCDIPDEYCDRVQPPTRNVSYMNDLEDIPNVSLSELNLQYYSRHDIPEEFCDRIQSDSFYSNDLDEKSEDTLNDFNVKFYSNYDIPEDAFDRNSDTLNNGVFVVLDLKSDDPSKNLEQLCFPTDQTLKENASLDENYEDVEISRYTEISKFGDTSSLQPLRNLDRKDTEEAMSAGAKKSHEGDDKDHEVEQSKDIIVNPDLEDIALYDNEINDGDNDDLSTLNALYYSKYDIPEDYEDRREIQKQKQQSSLEFAKNVIEQIKSSSDGKITNNSTAPFKSLVDLYTSVVEIRKILKSKGKDENSSMKKSGDLKEQCITEKHDLNIEERSLLSTSVCESKIVGDLDIGMSTEKSRLEFPVGYPSVISSVDKELLLSESTSCSSQSNLSLVDSNIFFSAVTVHKSVSYATSLDSMSGNYIVHASSEFCFDDSEPEFPLESDVAGKDGGIIHPLKNSNIRTYITFPQNSKSLREISNSSYKISPRLSMSDSCLSRKSQEDVETQTSKGNSSVGLVMSKCKRIGICVTTIFLLAWAFLFFMALFGMCFEWPPRYCMELHKMVHLRHIGPPVY